MSFNTDPGPPPPLPPRPPAPALPPAQAAPVPIPPPPRTAAPLITPTQLAPFAPHTPVHDDPSALGFGRGTPGPATVGAQPQRRGELAGELRSIITQWHVPALAIVAVIVIGLAMSASLLGFASSIDQLHIVDSLTPWQTLLLGFGVVLGGGLGLDPVAGGASSVSGRIDIVSVATIVALVAVSAVVTRAVLRRNPPSSAPVGAVLIRSLIEALPVALFAVLVAIFGRFVASIVIVGPHLVGVLLTVWLAVALGCAGARMWPTASQRMRAIIREPLTYAIVLVSVMSLVCLIAMVATSISTGHATALAWFAYGANAGIYLAILGQGGQIDGLTSLSRLEMHDGPLGLADVLAGGSILVIAVLVLVFAILSVRIGALRPRRSRIDAARLWPLPAGVFVLMLVFSYLIGPIRMTGVVAGSLGAPTGTAWIGPTVLSIVFVTAVAAVVSLCAEKAPALAYGVSPRLLRLLAGKRAAVAWVSGSAPTDHSGDVSLKAVPPVPLRRGVRRTVIAAIIAASIAIVAMVGAAATIAALNSTRGPEAAVEEYVTLIAEGKAAEANAMVKPRGNQSDRTLLSDEVLGAEGVTHITVGTITSDVDGDRGTATVHMSVDGEDFTAVLDVKQGEKEFGVLNTWVVDEPLVYEISVSGGGAGSVAVGGKEVDDGGTFLVYPGSYPVTAAAPSKYVEFETQQAVVGPFATSTITLESELTDAASEAVLAKVREHIKKCAADPDEESACPSVFYATSLASFTVKELPSSLDVFDTQTRLFESTEATVTMTPPSTKKDPKPKPVDLTFTVKGWIDVAEGEVVVSYDWYE